MELRTKKFIAREGLIALVFVSLSTLLFGASFYVSRNNNEEFDPRKLALANALESNAFPKRKLEILDELKRRGTLVKVEELGGMIKKEYPAYNDLSDRYLAEAFLTKYPEYAPLVSVEDFFGPKTPKERAAQLQAITLYLLIVGYPLYWLTRFVVWAVKTLKA